jgi:cytochrome P450 family 6
MASAVFEPTKWETIKFLFLQSFQDLSKTLGLTINTQKTIDFFMDVIKNSVKYREENNVKRNDFLQLLIQLKNSEAGLSINEMAANSCEYESLKCQL